MADWKKKDYAERAAKHGYEIKYGKTPKDEATTFVRHPDKTIYFDPKMAKRKYAERAWENPRVEGVNPLEGKHFSNKDKWYQFLHEHELAHLTHKRKEGESKAEYENRINQIALDALFEAPSESLGGLLSFLAEKGAKGSRLLGGLGLLAYPSSVATDEEEMQELRRLRGY